MPGKGNGEGRRRRCAARYAADDPVAERVALVQGLRRARDAGLQSLRGGFHSGSPVRRYEKGCMLQSAAFRS